MTDSERDTLNRLGEQIRPPDDSFDRLLTRRDRRRRNHRVTAAAVALSLTAVGIFGVLQIGRRNNTSTPGSGSAPLPNVARIECGPAGAGVSTSQVRPQADGVHLEVTNAGTTAVMFHVVLPELGGFVERAEPGPNTFSSSDLKPGAYEVRCFAEDELNPQNEPAAALKVTDQDGVWTNPAISCPAGQMEQSVVSDPAPGFQGEEGTPEEIARRQLGEYVRDGDVVERAGYPEAANPIVRVVRGDAVVAAVFLVSVIEGGHLVSYFSWCQEQGTQPEPNGPSGA